VNRGRPWSTRIITHGEEGDVVSVRLLSANEPRSGQQRELDKTVSGEIVTACEAYENLRFFCDEGGGRFGGSPGEARVRDYLLRKLQEYGLENVHTEEYSYTGWVRGPATLKVVAVAQFAAAQSALAQSGVAQSATAQPAGAQIAPVRSGGSGQVRASGVATGKKHGMEREFPCFSLPHSPAGDVEAEVVFVGPGGPAEFEEAGDVRGKAVIVTNEPSPGLGRMLHRSEKYGRAVKAGAAAFIYMRMGPMLAETGTVRHNETGAIPAVSTTREAGMEIRRLMERGSVRVRVTTTDEAKPLVGWNIIGEVPGASSPDKVILVGAHLDGHDISQAAADNGGGSAVILEAARVLAKHKDLVPKTVRFVWFTGEEIGLLGSNSYAQRHAGEADAIEFVFNCDVAGGGGTPGITAMGFEDTRKRFRQYSDEIGMPFRIGAGVMPYSDMYPFHLLGIPSVSFSSSAPDGSWNFVHTAADTLDKMTPRGLMLDSLVVARLLARLLYDPAIAHKTPEETAASVAHLGEVFEHEGRLPNGASKGLSPA
jgi:hypothetical protein